MAGPAAALMKGIWMFKTVQSVLAAVLLAVTAAELEETAPGSGAAKRERAALLLQQAIDPWLPEWLDPVLGAAAGFLIDAVVSLANRTGFFASLAAGSSS